MPLPKATLDLRTFDQLVTEARSQLPRLTSLWTDFNYSDPGITLIDLWAWLAEQNFYRFDRITPEMLRRFLRLIGITPRPPQLATLVAAIETSGAASISVPQRTVLSDASGTIVFETTRALTVASTTLVAFTQDSGPIVLTIAFDRAFGPAGNEVSMHVWTTQADVDRATRDALQAEASACFDPRRHYGVRTVWEYSAANGTWKRLDADDDTRALTLTGFVRFSAPADAASHGPDARFLVRCRIVRGRYDCPVRIARVAINAVVAEHAETIATEETLGVSRGHANDRYATLRAPIAPESMSLTLRRGANSDTSWTPCVEWDEIGAHDHAYRVDFAEGHISGGDGRRGAIMPAGWTLALRYRVGGGAAGNIAAQLLTRIDIPSLSVHQHYPAAGGADAEPLIHAHARAVDALAEVQRAVTVDDAAHLARRTPGVPVGRAWALADHHPTLPCVPAPGELTVVIVPDCSGPTPMPSENLLRAVEHFLEQRRLVTTAVHAVAPRYVEVAVHATLHASSAANDLITRATAAIARFFHPLHGGPAHAGWPAGRGIYRTEIMALLDRLDGVHCVTDLSFVVTGDSAPRCGNVEICAADLVAPGPHRLIVRTAPALRTVVRSLEHECP